MSHCKFHGEVFWEESPEGAPIKPDLTVGDSKDARAVAVSLAELAGMRAYHAGSLDNSAAAEALTSVLIGINRRYKADHAGIRITGILGDGSDASNQR